ncbi:hypothetical protein F4680DRAFT_416257 [Xylaria scruposa]|nr:hypothetical protein F4680DRAFT_416257 [Xylaria scruposa]
MEEDVMTCETCDSDEALKFCEGCNDYYCLRCWPKRRAHRFNEVGPNGIPHNQLEPEIVKKVNEWMAEPKDEQDEQKQHELDEESIWFGLSRNREGDPILAEYSRFAALMVETSEGAPEVRHPGLISFVGQTGAGKSTLIRLLIDAQSRSFLDNGLPPMAAPIIGRSNCDTPTSADVHLYVDPKTYKSPRPMLFADCEGFEGGERDPVAQAISSTHVQENTSPRAADTGGSLFRILRATKRALPWASRNAQDNEKTGKRQFTVSEMYPRILHAFSDVIVFVLNNPKTMEDVVERLLTWADANHSASINLPSKPHAVIALNKLNSSSTGDQWSRHRATEEFLKSMDAQILKNKTFEGYVKAWRQRKVAITNMEELFTCYYSSIHVVRLPDKSRYQLLHEQRDVLHEVIHSCCDRSFQKKEELKMLANVDQLQIYMTMAFDHFSETLDEPFDYVKASFKYRPPPETLADNLLEFVLLIAEKCGLEDDVEGLFNRVTDLVATCIMLDSARKQRYGWPEDWFDVEVPQLLMPESQDDDQSRPSASKQPGKQSYKGICRFVIQKYHENYSRCKFSLPKQGFTLPFQCEQTQKTHGPTHRQKTTSIRGTKELGGNFLHSFDPYIFAWDRRIRQKLDHMRDNLWIDSGSPRAERAKIQRHNLQSFYGPLVEYNLFCNSICLACLFNPPQYTLTCGHIICAQCAMDLGRLEHGTQLVVVDCPMAGKQGVCNKVSHLPKLNVPSVFQLAPAHSGLRVLSLDGGGIRGIVELTLLEAIESRIGVPLQRFFDLVVGTSTGGIIALGFGHKLWPINQCIKQFEDLARLAFTARRAQKYRGLRHIELLIRKSKYETKPLVEVLEKSLGTAFMFGSHEAHEAQPLKVAVTTTTTAGTKPYLLSNYNVRRSPLRISAKSAPLIAYTRYRPSSPQEEFRVWEAARATSAAPGFFTVFSKTKASPELMDGAVLFNNPIEIAAEEARRIAHAENLCEIPDIVVSVGTGTQHDDNDPEDDRLSKMPKAIAKPSFIKILFTIVRNQIRLTLDAEKRWKAWHQHVSSNRVLAKRSYRLNPDLGMTPLLDDVGSLSKLRQKAMNWARASDKIDHIACSLVASSFYFERVGDARKKQHSSIQVNGKIKCRLSGGTEDDIKRLGQFLRPCIKPAAFIVIDTEHDDQVIPLPVEQMITEGRFDGVPVTVPIVDEEMLTRICLRLSGLVPHTQVYDISGFPRRMMRCDFGPGRL